MNATGRQDRAERRREQRADERMLRRALKLMIEPGAVVEVRIIKRGGQIALGYFDDHELAIKAAMVRAANPDVKGIYIVMNRLRREVLARAHNRMLDPAPKGEGSKDHEVEHLRWLLLDCDIERVVKNISATEEEKQASRDTARAMRTFLTLRGWPKPAAADSGNGYHLLFRIDLANTKENVEIVRRVLLALAQRFDSAQVSIDRSVFNPSRIDKWYGSWVRKGDDVDERPWRQSALLEPRENEPDPEPVSLEQLTALASEAAEEKKEKASRNGSRSGMDPFDIDGFIAGHLADVAGEPEPYLGGRKWILRECPFHAHDHGGTAVIIQFDNGALSFACLGSHCRHLGWSDLREKFEPKSERQSAARNGDGSEHAGDEESGEPGVLPAYSEIRMAMAFTDRHHQDVRFVGDIKEWIVWDNGTKLWRFDNRRRVFSLAREIVREFAPAAGTPEKAAKIARASARAGVVSLASDDQRTALLRCDLDRHPMLVATPAGVLDLETGELRPNDRSLLITKTLAIAPAPPGTPHPIWDRFLRSTFVLTDADGVLARDENGDLVPDLEVIEFLWRFYGSCLTGVVDDQKFVFHYGNGRNGKGILVYAIRNILGEYAARLPSELFMERKFDPHRSEIADLWGTRLCVVSEIPTGARWNQARLMDLTGGDPVRANRMRQDSIEVPATHKLAFLGNTKPRFRTVNTAVIERLLLVRHPRKFLSSPDDARKQAAEGAALRDDTLRERLIAEYPAIFRWLIDGCRAWQTGGLKPPTSVLEATHDYLGDENLIAAWKGDCAAVAEITNEEDTISLLRASFNLWRRDRDEPPISERNFKRDLEAQGHRVYHSADGTHVVRLKLTDDAREQALKAQAAEKAAREAGRGGQRGFRADGF